MDYPLVSIVTPSYNQAQFIEETLLSVKGQDYPNLEHIVIDGGSTDGTVDILRRYEDEYNLRWVSEPDEGQSDAINKGFRMAKGEIIGWVNSDDTYMPGAVSAAVNHLRQNPTLGWLYGDVYWIDEDSYVLREAKGEPFDLKKLICKEFHPIQPTAFFRHQTLKSIGYLDTSLHFVMDTDLFIRLGVEYQAGYIPQVLATRRLHAQAKSVGLITDFAPEVTLILDKLFSNDDLPEDIASARDLSYRIARKYAYMYAGIAYLDSRRMKQARGNLWQALQINFKLFNKQSAYLALLLMQAALDVKWFCPREFLKRRSETEFRRRHREEVVDWFYQ